VLLCGDDVVLHVVDEHRLAAQGLGLLRCGKNVGLGFDLLHMAEKRIHSHQMVGISCEHIGQVIKPMSLRLQLMDPVHSTGDRLQVRGDAGHQVTQIGLGPELAESRCARPPFGRAVCARGGAS
jgi:hypothetical protein